MTRFDRVHTKCWTVLGLCWFVACGDNLGDPLEALRQASAGETVLLPDGTYAGPLVVPAGVTLKAEHAGGATIEMSQGQPAIVAETAPGSAPTVLSGLVVSSAGTVALLARGTGELRGEGLAIRCTRGVGVAAEGLASFSLSQSSVSGSVTSSDLERLVFPVKASEAPLVGLVLSRVKTFQLSDLSLEQFGGFGAVFVDSNGSWTQGTVSRNVGVGIMQDGGSVALSDVQVDGTVPGQRGTAILAYGMVATGKGLMLTSRLRVAHNSGYGLVQQDLSSQHGALTVQANSDVGIWLQNTTGTAGTPAIVIADAEILGNKGGGLFAMGSGGILLRDTTVSQAAEKKIPVEETGLTTMADGIQVSQLTGELRLEDLTLSDNARVGVLLSGPAAPGAEVSLSGVKITGSGSYGLILEDGHLSSPSWKISRDPKLEQADQGFTGRLGVASLQATVPSVSAIRKNGLLGTSGLLGTDGSGGAGTAVGQVGLIPEQD
jgi:hypothetical protein